MALQFDYNNTSLVELAESILDEARISTLASLPRLHITCPSCVRVMPYTYKNGFVQSHFSDYSFTTLCPQHVVDSSLHKIIRAFFIKYFEFCEEQPIEKRPVRPSKISINALSNETQFYVVTYKFQPELFYTGSVQHLAAPLLLGMWDDLSTILVPITLRGIVD